MTIHYVYKITDTNTNHYYFGSRTCKCNPEDDNYMGSMLTWDTTHSNLKKEILKSDFETRDEAVEYEAIMISLNIDDDLNENYHIPPDKFHTYGLPVVKDSKGNVFRVKKDDPRLKTGELEMFWSGRTHSEESKRKMSKSAKNRNITPEAEELRRQKISETMSGYKRSEKNIENIRKSKLGNKNPMSGRVWINNPETEDVKVVLKKELDIYLNKGYVKGRKINKP